MGDKYYDQAGNHYSTIKHRVATVVQDTYGNFKAGDEVVILNNSKYPDCILRERLTKHTTRYSDGVSSMILETGLIIKN